MKLWQWPAIGLAILFTLITPRLAQAVTLPSGQLVIKQVSVGSATDASDEMVVIFNNSTDSIQLQGLELEYKSATGKAWSRRAIINDSRALAAQAELTFANKTNHDVSLTPGLAATGGNLRLIKSGIVYDQLAWGTGDSPETTATQAPRAGQLIKRNCDSQTGQICSDTNNNAADFSLPIGESSASPAVASLSDLSSSPQKVAAKSANIDSKISGNSELSLEISELLPDPASPLTDSKDEFIELYNSGSSDANLAGWKLSDGKTSFKLDGQTIPAGQYLVLKSLITKLSLNNSGDVLQLIAPDGHSEFTTPNYGKAKVGKSFGASPAGWGWLENTSPGSVNGALMTNQADSPTAKKTSKTSSSTQSAKAAKAGKAPQLAKQNLSASSAEGGGNEDPSKSNKGTPWGWVLAGIGLLGLGYGAYEYRPELLAFITKLAAKFGAGH